MTRREKMIRLFIEEHGLGQIRKILKLIERERKEPMLAKLTPTEQDHDYASEVLRKMGIDG